MPQSAILGHSDLSDDYLLVNHLILICKFYIYNYRNLNIEHLQSIIDKIKSIDKEISKHEPKKRTKYLEKWHPFIKDIEWGKWEGRGYLLCFIIIMFNVISYRTEILVSMVFAVRADINQMSKISQQYPFLDT